MGMSASQFHSMQMAEARTFRSNEQKRMSNEKQTLAKYYAEYKDLKDQYFTKDPGSLERKGIEYQKEALFAKILDLEYSSTHYGNIESKSDFIKGLENLTHEKIENSSYFDMA